MPLADEIRQAELRENTQQQLAINFEILEARGVDVKTIQSLKMSGSTFEYYINAKYDEYQSIKEIYDLVMSVKEQVDEGHSHDNYYLTRCIDLLHDELINSQEDISTLKSESRLNKDMNGYILGQLSDRRVKPNYYKFKNIWREIRDIPPKFRRWHHTRNWSENEMQVTDPEFFNLENWR